MEDRPKKPLSVDIIAQMPRRDTYDKGHGTGSPNLDPGELQNSKAWREHASRKPAKPAKK